jgi:hypothetical protein
MTKFVSYTPNDLPPAHPRRMLREMDKSTFMHAYASGTLAKSARLGFDIHDAYIQERTQLEFGAGFEIVPRSRVTYSDIKLIPSAALTELGWHAERMIELRPFESDAFVCKQIEVSYADGRIREGAGILVEQTSAKWVPAGHMVLALVAERLKGQYASALNPF